MRADQESGTCNSDGPCYNHVANPSDLSMIASDIRNGVEQLGDLIATASTIVPFTGAGISTECGIPDFRSPGGLWARHRPIPFDEFVASPDARAEAWRRRFAMEPVFAQARPGRGHRALASLYRAGKIPAIITQNIDNLHQTSGFAAEHVIEHKVQPQHIGRLIARDARGLERCKISRHDFRRADHRFGSLLQFGQRSHEHLQ